MTDNMKMTLLQMVQSILSSMNSDEVNSISDSAESLQVARAVEQTYWNMLGRYDLPEHNQIMQLQSSGNATQPTLMIRPPGVTRIEWIKYFDTNPLDSTQTDQFGSFSHGLNTDIVPAGWTTTSSTSNTIQLGPVTFTVTTPQPNPISLNDVATCVSGINSMTGNVTAYSFPTLTINITSIVGSGTFSQWTIFNGTASTTPGYRDVHILPFEEFMQMNVMMNPSIGDIGSMQLGVVENDTGSTQNFLFYYRNDKQPQYCTVISNQFVIFDSYDNTQDTTLQQAKTMCWGWVYPTFSLTDTFVPNLDAQQFPLLVNDAKALVFFEQKQFPHTKAEEEVGRQLTSLQKWKAIAGRISDEKDMFFRELPNFGR